MEQLHAHPMNRAGLSDYWRNLPEHRKGFFYAIAMIVLGVIFAYKPNPKPVFNEVTHKYYFGGSECADDCTWHRIGYQWAQDHDITSPDDCVGDSQSFIEGCQVWADEVSTAREEDADSDPY